MGWFVIYACIRTIRIHHEGEGVIETRIMEYSFLLTIKYRCFIFKKTWKMLPVVAEYAEM